MEQNISNPSPESMIYNFPVVTSLNTPPVVTYLNPSFVQVNQQCSHIPTSYQTLTEKVIPPVHYLPTVVSPSINYVSTETATPVDFLSTKCVPLCESLTSEVPTQTKLKSVTIPISIQPLPPKSFNKGLVTKANIFSCQNCDDTFQHKSSLVNHMRSHKKRIPITCKICNKQFLNFHYIKAHMHTHLPKDKLKKEFACEICGKSFATKYRVNMHAIVHNNEKEHICKLCNKCYARKATLHIHMLRIHSSNMSFICEFCQSCFSCKSDLRHHKKCHEGNDYTEIDIMNEKHNIDIVPDSNICEFITNSEASESDEVDDPNDLYYLEI